MLLGPFFPGIGAIALMPHNKPEEYRKIWVNHTKPSKVANMTTTKQCFFVVYTVFIYIWYIVECRYNAVQYNMILHTSLQKLGQNINHWLKPQKTPHTSPWRASYGMSFVNILDKIGRVITAPHSTWIYFVYTMAQLSEGWTKWPPFCIRYF